jgi:Trypsin-like peptidase domain
MTDQSAPLGGEADPNSWHFQRSDQEGPLPNPIGHTFPILTHNPLGVWELVGTGFYISGDGLFVTARHVVDHVLSDGKQIAPLVIVQPHSDTGLFGPSQVLFRPIMQCWLGDPADVALGVAATATNNQTGEILRHWSWPLSWSIPADGERVGTYAFPRHKMSLDGRSLHFHPELYRGTVLRTGKFRDRSMVPFPYLEVDCRIHGAASGGPIAQVGGRVVGVNCTELAPLDCPPAGWGAQIRCLQDAFIDDASLSGENPRRVTFDELVHAGCINVANYVASGRPPTSSPPVRLDQVLVTAPRPQISFVQ